MLYEKREHIKYSTSKNTLSGIFLFDYFFKPSFLTSVAYRFGDFFSRYFI